MATKKPKNKLSLDSYCKMLVRFRQYKDMPSDEFLEVAKKKWIEKYGAFEEEQEKEAKVKKDSLPYENKVGLWANKPEAANALALYNNYKKDREITDFSDLEVLKQLVYYEIFLKRLQKDLNKDDKTNTYTLKAYNDITSQILTIKKNLGLLTEKQELAELEKNKSSSVRVNLFTLLKSEFTQN